MSTLNELQNTPHRRYNPLLDEWILVSPHRSNRPWNGKEEPYSYPSGLENNYLFPGNVRSNGTQNPNYKNTYVFENDFPALRKTETSVSFSAGLLKAVTEVGICKVICFHPNPYKSLATMTLEEITHVIKVWLNEFKQLSTLPEINYIQLFENKGEIMGCSNPHPHGQIWAQQSIPTQVKKEQQQQSLHFQQAEKPLLEQYLQEEIQNKERIVYQNDHFVILVPFWASWPFETMLLPKQGFSNLNSFNPSLIPSLAEALSVLTKVYDKVFNCPFPYSAGMHQAPCDGNDHPEWTWHMHFFPPLLRSQSVKKFMVGYELLAEPQRDISPEFSANTLRTLADKLSD